MHRPIPCPFLLRDFWCRPEDFVRGNWNCKIESRRCGIILCLVLAQIGNMGTYRSKFAYVPGIFPRCRHLHAAILALTPTPAGSDPSFDGAASGREPAVVDLEELIGSLPLDKWLLIFGTSSHLAQNSSTTPRTPGTPAAHESPANKLGEAVHAERESLASLTESSSVPTGASTTAASLAPSMSSSASAQPPLAKLLVPPPAPVLSLEAQPTLDEEALAEAIESGAGALPICSLQVPSPD